MTYVTSRSVNEDRGSDRQITAEVGKTISLYDSFDPQ